MAQTTTTTTRLDIQIATLKSGCDIDYTDDVKIDIQLAGVTGVFNIDFQGALLSQYGLDTADIQLEA